MIVLGASFLVKLVLEENGSEEALKLALKEGITAYDALYIQLAKSLRANLATFDKKLSKTAIKHGIATHP